MVDLVNTLKIYHLELPMFLSLTASFHLTPYHPLFTRFSPSFHTLFFPISPAFSPLFTLFSFTFTFHWLSPSGGPFSLSPFPSSRLLANQIITSSLPFTFLCKYFNRILFFLNFMIWSCPASIAALFTFSPLPPPPPPPPPHLLLFEFRFSHHFNFFLHSYTAKKHCWYLWIQFKHLIRRLSERVCTFVCRMT